MAGDQAARMSQLRKSSRTPSQPSLAFGELRLGRLLSARQASNPSGEGVRATAINMHGIEKRIVYIIRSVGVSDRETGRAFREVLEVGLWSRIRDSAFWTFVRPPPWAHGDFTLEPAHARPDADQKIGRRLLPRSAALSVAGSVLIT